MANRIVSINDNKVYSEIILIINKNKYTSTDLAQRLKKEQSPLARQLKFLHKKGYLILEKEKHQYNKKLYSVNWYKISKEFFDYLKTQKSNIEIKEIYIKNKYFVNLLKELFGKYSVKPVTISRIFDQIKNNIRHISNYQIPEEFQKIFYIEGGELPNQELEEFRKIVMLCAIAAVDDAFNMIMFDYMDNMRAQFKKMKEETN